MSKLTMFPSGVAVHSDPDFVMVPARLIQVRRSFTITMSGVNLVRDVVLHTRYRVSGPSFAALGKDALQPAFNHKEVMQATLPFHGTPEYRDNTQDRDAANDINGRIERIINDGVSVNSLSQPVPGSMPDMEAQRKDRLQAAEESLAKRLAYLADTLDIQNKGSFSNQEVKVSAESDINDVAVMLEAYNVMLPADFSARMEHELIRIGSSSGRALAAAA